MTGKRVIEVGSLDENGSLRPHVMGLVPLAYIGVDVRWGRLVDALCPAEHLVDRYGAEAFDLVISTEMLEHAEWWQRAVWAMKAVTVPGGVTVLTTRSPGFGYHPFPEDWWRFEVSDLFEAFGDWAIEDLRKDPGEPGVFIRARRPLEWDAESGWTRLVGLAAARAPQEW